MGILPFVDMNTKEKYMILCFGDSLTEGWYDRGTKRNPYTNQLNKLVEQKYPGLFEAVPMGVAGETTIDD